MPRNHFEETIDHKLLEKGVVGTYEKLKIPWVLHENKRYTPDWFLPNGIVVEGKGQFRPGERKKHLQIKQQYPDLELRFVFCRAPGSRKPGSAATIAKNSKTTYGAWCQKNGFQYADDNVPDAWFDEPAFEASRAIIQDLLNGRK